MRENAAFRCGPSGESVSVAVRRPRQTRNKKRFSAEYGHSEAEAILNQNYELFTYLAYDGTNYCGFQVQPNGRSVAATFQDALEAVLGSRPDIKGCSRTDAGVHALGFRLNFHADTRIPPQKLPLALNQHLPPDIRVLAAQTVPEDFHARYAAHTKTYLYRIHNNPIDSPFDAAYYTGCPGGWTKLPCRRRRSSSWAPTIFWRCARRAVLLRPRGHRAHHHGLPCHPARGRGGH